MLAGHKMSNREHVVVVFEKCEKVAAAVVVHHEMDVFGVLKGPVQLYNT